MPDRREKTVENGRAEIPLQIQLPPGQNHYWEPLHIDVPDLAGDPKARKKLQDFIAGNRAFADNCGKIARLRLKNVSSFDYDTVKKVLFFACGQAPLPDTTF